MQDHNNLPIDVSIQFQVCFAVRELILLLKEVSDIRCTFGESSYIHIIACPQRTYSSKNL